MGRAGDTNLLNFGHKLIKFGFMGIHGYSMTIRSILLKNWEGIRDLGKVFVYFFDFSKCSNTFSNIRFRILWDTLEYFILWNTLEYFEILCGISMTYEKNGIPKGIYLGLTLNTFRIPFEYHEP